MYRVKPFEESPLPSEGPALIVCDHTSLGDPLVLLATAGRAVRFLMAEEIYSQRHIRWAFQALRCIPVQRGKRDIRAIRTMLDYLAIKSGAPVIPASIVWEGPHSVTSMMKTFFVPRKTTIQFGQPLQFPQEIKPSKDSMQLCTKEIMKQIETLKESILSGVS
jgi:1-acyl-sn-glycerol-3-phosphate acyltransferase